jgi:hypothetical protein
MNIGKQQSPRIIRIQKPTPIELPRRPAQEPEPAIPEPVTVPVRPKPDKQPAGK